MDTEQEIEKLKYHIKLLARVLNLKRHHPLEDVIIQLGWGEDEEQGAYHQFEICKNRIESGSETPFLLFGERLRRVCGLDQHQIKDLIMAFYGASVYREVCGRYMKTHPSTEFREFLQADGGGLLQTAWGAPEAGERSRGH